MRIALITFTLVLGAFSSGYAQTQSSTTTEKTKQQSQATINPDGTAVHHAQTTHERTDSSTNPDGTSTTVHTQQKNTHTRVKTDTPAGSKTTERRSSSSSTMTTNPPPANPPLY